MQANIALLTKSCSLYILYLTILLLDSQPTKTQYIFIVRKDIVEFETEINGIR